MTLREERGRLALYIGCMYMPTDSVGTFAMDDT